MLTDTKEGIISHFDGEVTLLFHPETLRLLGYGAFWTMVMLAVIVTRTFVEADFTNSSLVKTFGYNNICINWDYSPSREITAMFYPLVEFPLVGYVLLTFLQARQDFWANKIPKSFYTFCCVALPFQLVLLVWFRMIFVVDGLVEPIGHTVGFLGLQIVLVLVSIQNGVYNYIRGQVFPCLRKYPVEKSKRWTAALTLMYVSVMIVVTLAKLIIALTLFAGSPLIDTKSPAGAKVAYGFDVLWMLVAAVMPIPFAIMERMSEPAIKVTLWPSQRSAHQFLLAKVDTEEER
jgi:hypothetical protein